MLVMSSAPLENIVNIADIVLEDNIDLNKNLRGFPTNLDT